MSLKRICNMCTNSTVIVFDKCYERRKLKSVEDRSVCYLHGDCRLVDNDRLTGGTLFSLSIPHPDCVSIHSCSLAAFSSFSPFACCETHWLVRQIQRKRFEQTFVSKTTHTHIHTPTHQLQRTHGIATAFVCSQLLPHTHTRDEVILGV